MNLSDARQVAVTAESWGAITNGKVEQARSLCTGSATFYVRVTTTSLAGLVDRFLADDHGIANALDVKLAGAAKAKTDTGRDNELNAFENQVATQAGKALTDDQAQLLIELAQAME